MIKGVGIDLVETERIERSINKDRGFRELVFASEEIDYCESQTHKFQHYAARFAAKEAFMKALGTGWAEGTAFNEIYIENDKKGKPLLILKGQTANTLSHINVASIQVSLSHTATMATAIVMVNQ